MKARHSASQGHAEPTPRPWRRRVLARRSPEVLARQPSPGPVRSLCADDLGFIAIASPELTAHIPRSVGMPGSKPLGGPGPVPGGWRWGLPAYDSVIRGAAMGVPAHVGTGLIGATGAHMKLHQDAKVQCRWKWRESMTQRRAPPHPFGYRPKSYGLDDGPYACAASPFFHSAFCQLVSSRSRDGHFRRCPRWRRCQGCEDFQAEVRPVPRC